jgi:hypothetical protein
VLVCVGLCWFALVCVGLRWFALVCVGLRWFALEENFCFIFVYIMIKVGGAQVC